MAKGLRRLVESSLPDDVVQVQRSTLGLDVVPRYVCNTWDEAVDNGGKPFDAVVIGAGMFGGYCAAKIVRFGAAKGLRVLVLDAGPYMVSTHIQNLPRLGLNVPVPIMPSADSGTPRELIWGMPWRSNVEFVGQAYCIGGKSLYWGGWCPRLLASDLDAWPPTVAHYIEQNYSTLERQTGVEQRTQFIQGPLFQLLKDRITTALQRGELANLDSVEDPPLAVEGQSPASGLFSFDKYSSMPLLIDTARQATNASDDKRDFFIVPNAYVTRLAVGDGAVRGIQALVNGQLKFIEVSTSCSVVLALGTIESTRLALISFPRNLDPALELMGRNLMSHVRTNVSFRVRRAALDPTTLLPKVLQTGALLVRGSTLEGKFQLQITASAGTDNDSDGLLYKMIPDVDQLDETLGNQESGWISITVRGASEMKGDKVTPVPNANGRWIDLSPAEYDQLGMPRAYVQLKTSATEDSLAGAMDAAIMSLANALAGDNPADLQRTGSYRDPLGSTYHEAGTLWMGTDPATSVTDESGRFHHVSNAYCCDQSLFVTVGSVNPTLTGLVLSRRVAEAIVARHV